MITTQPSRPVFGNIPLGGIIYTLAALVLVVLAWALYRRYKMWQVGQPDATTKILFSKRISIFLKTVIIDGFLHRKFLGYADNLGHRPFRKSDLKARELYAGLSHYLLFIGCGLLLLATLVGTYHGIKGTFYLYFSLFSDIGGLLALGGLVMIFIRRYILKPRRLDNKTEDLIALSGLLLLVVTGFIVEGLRIAAFELPVHRDWSHWSPGGYILAIAFTNFSYASLTVWHRIWWWIHVLLTFGFMAYVAVYFNRLWHILISPLNIFWRNLQLRGAMTMIDLEKAEHFGVAKIQDFSRKNILDLDACTRCGRCQDNCPANLTQKPLSPKKILQDLKSNWLEKAPALVNNKKRLKSANTASHQGETVNEQPSADEKKPLVGGVIETEAIWNCTTCLACQEVCPVWAEPMYKITEMRRNLVMEQSIVPETAEGALRSIEDRGHPWRGTQLTRSSWMEGLNIHSLNEDSQIDVLYWVGCTEALEDRSLKVAQATAQLFRKAGVKFGVLGEEESCCGDPARRLGNEYLFQMQAQRNIEILNKYRIKKIVTGCAHCFNTLKNEYPQFQGNYSVVHHTDFISELIKEGRLKMGKRVNGIFTYHDPCYLARYNDVYTAPRSILEAVPGLRLNEMTRNRERSFCCGAGGGHMWLEEQKVGERINVERTQQALQVKARTVATACPYCLQMFEDGIKTKGVEETLQVKDIAEIVLEAMV